MKKVLNSIIKYFKGVRKEINRIRWTTPSNLFKYSLTSVLFMVFFGVYFYVIDILASLLIRSVS